MMQMYRENLLHTCAHTHTPLRNTFICESVVYQYCLLTLSSFGGGGCGDGQANAIHRIFRPYYIITLSAIWLFPVAC